jgi:hypothetical protein
MIKSPRRRCEETNCKELALYGVDTHQHCERHKLKDEINYMENHCVSCNLLGIIDKNGHCDTCDPVLFKKVRLAKQNAVRDFLISENILFDTVDRMIDGGICGRERPDFYMDCGTHFLVLEVDENQHSGRPCECEQTRMVNISQSNGLKTLFLRYNPDKYKPGELSMETTTKRLDTLLDWVKFHIKTEPQYFLSAQYLFFDGFKRGDSKIDQVFIPLG